jgi:mycothiol synthase
VAGLLLAADLHDFGSPDYTREMLEHDWRLPRLDLSRDVLVVEAPDRSLAGYAWLYDRDRHLLLLGWGVVHPEHRGRGIGSFLLLRRERRAEEHAKLAPPGEPVLLRIDVAGPDRAGHDLAERHGYRPVRHFWQMVADLPDEIPLPVWPERLTVRTFVVGEDERAVHAAVMESFADHWGSVNTPYEEWAAMRFGDPTFAPDLWFLAGDGEQLAGVLLGTVLEGFAWVSTLGVRSGWRRRGVGRALLLHAFAEFRRRGLATVKLDVDSENATGATDLYERVGMRVERQYDVYEKRIR